MTTHHPKIDLSRFCVASSDIRYYLARPFLIAGGTAASNGYMLVWIDHELPDAATDVPGKAIPEIVESARAITSQDGDFVRAVDVRLDTTCKCAVCGGSGLVVQCGSCSLGAFHRDGHDYDCKACDGNGYRPATAVHHGNERCSDCIGTGLQRGRPSPICHDHMTIQSCFVAALRDLPNCEIRSTVHANQWFFFRFDGGFGAVLPMRGSPLAPEASQ